MVRSKSEEGIPGILRAQMIRKADNAESKARDYNCYFELTTN